MKALRLIHRLSLPLFIATMLTATCFLSGCNGGDGNQDTTVEPHKEQRGVFTVVWLRGTAYEMGFQQGELLHDEIEAAMEFIENDVLLSSMEQIARNKGILDMAYSHSYQDIIDECQGIVDALPDVDFTMDKCLVLNFGDVLVEFIMDGMPEEMLKHYQPGCTEIAASGNATVDGRLYHGRILDWEKIDYILDYPTIFVRQPVDGIPHVYIGFPANLSPYSGMNDAGISAASNEAHPFDQSCHDLTGRSHVQMLGQLLKNVHSMEEAKQFVNDTDHMTAELIMVTDGNTKEAAVFEMTAKNVGIRELSDDGLLYATNHYLAPDTREQDKEPTNDANLLRYDRLEELLTPTGKDTKFGQLDPASIITVMRDRVNPWTGIEQSIEEFDNGESLATYGALFQIVFDPEKRWFWVAAGQIPVPQQPFVGFSMDELLGRTTQGPDPAVYQ